MELLKEEEQKNVSLSTQENEYDNKSIDLSKENLYDSFRDRFTSDYEDDF